MNKILNMLGIARRAGKLVLGTDSLINAFPSKKVKLVFIASDASEQTIDKFDKKAYFYQVRIINKFNTEELSKALGVTSIKVIGLLDEGFAGAILKELERGELL